MKTNRPSPWFHLLLLVAAGCGAQTWTNQTASCQSEYLDDCRNPSQDDAGRQVPEVGEVGDGNGSYAGAVAGIQQLGSGTFRFMLGQDPPLYLSISLPWSGLAVIVVRDGEGNAVRNVSLTASLTDPNDPIFFEWDGLDDSGQPEPPGIYTAEVSVSDGEPLRVNCAFVPPVSTGEITTYGNLSSTATAMTWDPAKPFAGSNFTTTMTIYDSLGEPVQLNIYFCKNDPGNTAVGDSGDWTYHVMTDGGNLARDGSGNAATPGTATEVASGVLQFDQSGRLVSNTLSPLLAFNPKDSVNPQILTFNFGTGTAIGGSGIDGFTQFPAASEVDFTNQEGESALVACVATISTPGAGLSGQSTLNASATPLGATASITICGNLDYDSPPTTFDPDNSQTTSDVSVDMVVHDSLGRAIEVDVYFCKNEGYLSPADSGDWTYHVVTAPGYLAAVIDDANPAWMSGPVEIGTGVLRFDVSGVLNSNTMSATASFVPKGGTKPQLIRVNFRASTGLDDTGADALTQYAAPTAITLISEQRLTGE